MHQRMVCTHTRMGSLRNHTQTKVPTESDPHMNPTLSDPARRSCLPRQSSPQRPTNIGEVCTLAPTRLSYPTGESIFRDYTHMGSTPAYHGKVQHKTLTSNVYVKHHYPVTHGHSGWWLAPTHAPAARRAHNTRSSHHTSIGKHRSTHKASSSAQSSTPIVVPSPTP